MRERASSGFRDGGVGKAGVDRGDSCDLVLRGGRIYTVDPRRPWAEALAIGGGRFLRVGDDGEMEGLIGEDTEVVDLEGRLVIPGIYDTHVHLVTAVHSARSHCRLPEPASNPGVDDYLSAIEKAHREGGGIEDGWFLGGVWSPFPFALGGPRREMLDEILGDVPAFLVDTTLHAAWVNSAALQIAGIDKNTPDPQFGMIVRDTDTGEPTGYLVEYSGMALVGRHIPRLPTARRMELAERGIAELNSHGVVGFCEAASEEADLVALHRLARDGRLDARVLTRNLVVQAGSVEENLPAAEEIASLGARYSVGRLDGFGAKIYVDGIFMNDTVAFLDRRIPFEMPYRHGDLTISPEKLAQAVTEFDRHRLPIMMHCIGDKAVRVALDAVEAARTKNGDSGVRHCITHGFIASPQDIPRFSELGVALSLQTWASTNSDFRLVVTPRIGEKRWEEAFPYKSLADAGASLSIGSDWPCVTASCNPFPGLAMVSTRIDPFHPDRGVFNPRERLTIEELIPMLTLNGARLMGLEEISGSIQVDKSADLAVLDRNIFECLPEELAETRVLLTLLEGSPVYHSEDSPMLRSDVDPKTTTMWR